MFLRLLAGYNSRKLVSVSSILPSKSLALISMFKKKKKNEIQKPKYKGVW